MSSQAPAAAAVPAPAAPNAATAPRRPAGAAAAKARSQTSAADSKNKLDPKWLVKIPPYLHEKLKAGAEQASVQQAPLELGFVTVTRREDGERDVSL